MKTRRPVSRDGTLQTFLLFLQKRARVFLREFEESCNRCFDRPSGNEGKRLLQNAFTGGCPSGIHQIVLHSCLEIQWQYFQGCRSYSAKEYRGNEITNANIYRLHRLSTVLTFRPRYLPRNNFNAPVRPTKRSPVETKGGRRKKKVK